MELNKMKQKEIKKVDLWFDKQINLWCASFKDSQNNDILEPECGTSKTMALKSLMDNAPETLFLPTNKKDFRDY